MAKVDGKVVKVGDWVSFKSDIEQCGRIVAIKQSIMGSDVLILENEDGFDGEYIGGETRTQEMASDCWLE
jgi:hypothetical protein